MRGHIAIVILSFSAPLLLAFCLCMPFCCPLDGAGYGWLSWNWKGFPASLPANSEATWGWQEVSTPVPLPVQTVHHVYSQCRGGIDRECQFDSCCHLPFWSISVLVINIHKYENVLSAVSVHPGWKWAHICNVLVWTEGFCCVHVYFKLIIIGKVARNATPCSCDVSVTDVRCHGQLGGVASSQRGWWTDLHYRGTTLHEKRTGHVWVWLGIYCGVNYVPTCCVCI